MGRKMATKNKSGKIRIIFGRDMSEAEIVDAVIRMANEYGIPFKDDRKRLGIPIVDSRKKERIKYRRENGISIVNDRKKVGKGFGKRRERAEK